MGSLPACCFSTADVAGDSCDIVGGLCQAASWIVTTLAFSGARCGIQALALAWIFSTRAGDRFCESTSARFLASASFWLAATRYQNRASSTLAFVPRARSYMTAKLNWLSFKPLRLAARNHL